MSDYGESSIGWIFSVYIFLTFFCGVQIGPVFDARGPRLLVLLGSILMMASLMLIIDDGQPYAHGNMLSYVFSEMSKLGSIPNKAQSTGTSLLFSAYSVELARL